MPQQQQIKFSFEAPDDLHTRQRLGRGYAHDRRDQLIAQRARPAASMAKLDQQSEYALLASRVCPVVDQLTVHTESFTNDHRTKPVAREHQQRCHPCAHGLVRMIDRQLLRVPPLDFSQDNDVPHTRLRRTVFPKLSSFNFVYQRHIFGDYIGKLCKSYSSFICQWFDGNVRSAEFSATISICIRIWEFEEVRTRPAAARYVASCHSLFARCTASLYFAHWILGARCCVG